MELTKDTYTKEEVLEMITQLQNELEQYKLQAQEFEQIKVQMGELGKKNLENEIKLYLAKQGLDDDVFDLVYSEDMEQVKTKVEKLKKLQKQQQIDQAYIPENKVKDDLYQKAEQKGDIQTMLKAKFSKILG